MKVSQIMTENPVCCDQHDSIEKAAGIMVTCDCGIVPIVNSQAFLVGVITDRDITCRAVASGKVFSGPVQQFMSSPALSVRPNASVEDCANLMQEHQVRRLVVTDAEGLCLGIVSQADLAKADSGMLLTETVRQISQPTQAGAYLG